MLKFLNNHSESFDKD